MEEILIVDGYNILHAWGSFKQTMAEDLEHARDRLVKVLDEYRVMKGIDVVIVFDAHSVKGGAGSSQTVNGVEVVYTAEGETADMVIEKLVGQIGDSRRVTVATSDWAQQRIVFGKGAARLSARELEQEVISCKKEVEEHFSSLQHGERKLQGYLKDDIREILERIRRQK